MRKAIRFILILVVSVFVLLLLATVALRIVYPPAKLSRLVSDKVRKELHREARLEGVSLGMGGLLLKGFQLSEVPGFSAGTFLTVDQAEVRWAWLPLLSKQIVIENILFERPQIHLVRMPDGKTLNVTDLAGSASAADAPTADKAAGKPAPVIQNAGLPAAARSATSGWSWKIYEIHLQHGIIQFEDRSPDQQSSTLSDIDLLIQGFDPTRLQGRLTIGQLQNPVYTARDITAEWALRDITSNLEHLNGWMRLHQGPGLIQNLNDLVHASKGAKLALMPLIALQHLDRLGFIRLGLPDFSHVPITGIQGDYAFRDGTMKIHTFAINSPQFTLGALGAVELAPGNLAIDIMLHTPQPTLLGELDLKMHISGTLDHPHTDLGSLKKKAFKATIKQLFDKPGVKRDIDDTLKKLFH